MASYKIEVSESAEKQIKRLPRGNQIKVLTAIAALGRDPKPVGCRKLKGFKDVYRIRVGFFRVLYTVQNELLVVIVLKVGHRKDVYR